MRWLFCWCCLVGGLIAADAAAPAGVAATHQDCRVILPAGWVQDPDFSSRTRTWRAPQVVAPPEPGADPAALQAFITAERLRPAITIGWQEVAAEATAATLIQESWLLLARLAVNAERLEGVQVTITGRDWFRLDYRFTLGDEAWRQRLWVTVDAGRKLAWTVTLSSGEPEWDEATVGIHPSPTVIANP